MPNIKDQIKTRTKELQKEIRKSTVSYISAALGLVAGLAWNDAVRSLIEYVYPRGANTLLAKFIYAAIVTVIVVAVSIQLSKLLEEKAEGK